MKTQADKPQDGRINILLVDDQPENLRALEVVLADLGQNLVRANSGKEALRALLDRDFAVILLDVQMPEMDGFETASLIRQRKKTEHTPIIFVTAISQSDQHVAAGYALGAVDYIFKPVVPEILRSKVSVFVELEKQNHQIRELNRVLQTRATDLEMANRELEAFSYSVSHDLGAPLRSIEGFVHALEEECGGVLDANAKNYLQRVHNAASRMSELIRDLLEMSRVTRTEMQCRDFNISEVAREIIDVLKTSNPARQLDFHAPKTLNAFGDPRLLRIVLENLLGNAFKFTAKKSIARIELGSTYSNGMLTYFVRDNGAGFDMAYADKLFGPFQRLHRFEDFPGTGVGLATVQRIIRRHGGEIWVEAGVEKGATFYFTLSEPTAGETALYG